MRWAQCIKFLLLCHAVDHLIWNHVDAVLDKDIVVPNLPDKSYQVPGDVLLGGMFPIQGFSAETPCGPKLRNEGIIQYVEAMVFAIQSLNNNTEILPNITLGFKILDTCVKESTALAQALKFVPRQKETDGAKRIAGVIGPMKSSNSIEVSTLLGQFSIPQLSYASSSDTLSDTTRFPNFFRTVPPDQFQVKTMMEILKHFNWSYISVLHTDDVYGLDAMKSITRFAKQEGVCIAYQKTTNEWTSDEDYDYIMKQLMRNKNAHAVILFMGPQPTKRLFEAAMRQGAEGMFTWIACDAWASRVHQYEGLENITSGAILVKPISIQMQQFHDYFVKLTPENRLANPWFQEFWQMHFDCGQPDKPCPETTRLTKDTVRFMSSLAPIVDAVHALGIAMDAQTREACPSGVNASNFYTCYDGALVNEKLFQTDFQGQQGQVIFNEKGDYLGRYVVEQYQKQDGYYDQPKYNYVELAIWNARNDSIDFDGEHYHFYDINGQHVDKVPESVCSKECKLGEFKVQLELKCCWECRKCRLNEIVTENGTNCQACPIYHWPDQENFVVCHPIEPSYISLFSTAGISLTAVAGTGMVATALTIIFYIRHNDKRLIKASSRELSYIMMIGIFLGYATTIGFLLRPSNEWCPAVYSGFCLGFVWIYGPLLVKTNRILRIFNAGRRGKKSPKLIGSGVQIAIAMTLIFIQIAITVSSTVLVPPTAELDQPAINRRYVELSCTLPTEGMVAFLAYNLFLVVLCTIHAFFARKLPDNFNEARFITMCVYATLITWIAFVPTYFTTAQPYYRILLLGLALILNDTLALFFLFWPKAYAVLFVKESDQKLGSAGKAGNGGNGGNGVQAASSGTNGGKSTDQTNDNTSTGKSRESKSEMSKSIEESKDSQDSDAIKVDDINVEEQ